MMKVFAFMAIAVTLVVGVISSSEDSSDESHTIDRSQWDQQCRDEIGFNPDNATHTDENESAFGCYVACLLEKSESIKNGRLGEREKVTRELADEWSFSGTQPKEGRTFLQLAEKCYDEAKVKTDKCEIGYAVGKCLAAGVEKAVESQSSEEKESAIPRLG